MDESAAHSREKSLNGDLTKAVDILVEDLSRSAARHDAEAQLPPEIIARLHRAGLLGLTAPVADGGRDGDLRCAAMVVSRLAQGDSSVALILAMQFIYVTSIVRSEAWPVAVRRSVGQAAAQTGALFNALRAEPDLGTPARGGLPSTTARRVEGGWRLSGRKIYATGGKLLRFALVWAKTDDLEPRTGFFLTPLDAPGVRMIESWDHLGMRATSSHTFAFDEVALPLENAGELRPAGQWRELDPIQAVWNSVLVAALYDGIARAARTWLVGYLKARAPSNLNAPLASLPRFQELLGEMEALLFASDCALERAFVRMSRPVAAHAAEASLIKYLATNNATRVVELGVAAIGNAGLSRVFPLERFYRDVLCSRVHVPQNDMILSAVGRSALE
jgi:alkylation response protein AidB-like acyl-CoA dehydrogenase